MEEKYGTFPLGWAEGRRFLGFYVLFTAIGSGIGWLITHPLRTTWVQRMDEDIEERLVAQRTPTMNTLTFLGSQASDTIVKVALTAIVCVTMLLVWRRWREPVVIVCALVLEAASFITITTIVGRSRPDVDQLDSSPVGSSFPSGHTAAAVVYGAMVVVVFWHTRRRWIRWGAVLLVACVVVVAGYSRMYRGMHHLTDVLAGVVLGVASLVATVHIVTTSTAATDVDEPELAPCS